LACADVQGRQGGDEREIGGGEIVGGEIGRANPGDGDVFVRMGRGSAGGEPAEVGDHFDDDSAVVMREAGQRVEIGQFASEFFADFPKQGGAGVFGGFDLAAGEFPFKGKMLVGRPLGEEDAAGRVDDNGGDNGNRGGHGVEGGRRRTEGGRRKAEGRERRAAGRAEAQRAQAGGRRSKEGEKRCGFSMKLCRGNGVIEA